MADEKNFTEQEAQKTEQKQLKLALDVLKEWHQKNNLSFIAINSNGIVDATGNQYEITYLLEVFSDELKVQNANLLKQRQEQIRKQAEQAQKTNEALSAEQPEQPKVEIETKQEVVAEETQAGESAGEKLEKLREEYVKKLDEKDE